MAILKHIAIKNLDYGAIQRYLLFRHDESSRKLLHDDHGNMILRQGLIQSSLNCDPFTFNTECTELNHRFGKNLQKSDIHAHHYIISFDPQDVSTAGLTAEKAQALGEEFARHFFAGHQTLIVTHPDGDNHSGNLHCHIVINSLRKLDVLWQEFMERPHDAATGFKHHLTKDLLRAMQPTLNELCEREHLQTADFSVSTDRHVSDREYRAEQRGQKSLNALNDRILQDGLIPRRSKFATIKQQLREAIDTCVQNSSSKDAFIELLKQQYGVEVKLSRGSLSYIHSDYGKPIRGRSLGRRYEQEELEARFLSHDAPALNVKPEHAALPKIFLIHSELRLVTDLQTCVKAQQSRAYARKVTISNLQQMARSVAYLQDHCIGTLDKLQKLRAAAEAQYKTASSDVRETQIRLTSVNTQLHYMGQYLSGKKLYAEFLTSDDKPTFRAAHRPEIDEYKAAAAYLKAIPDKQGFVPIDNLRKEKDALQKDLTHKKSVLRPYAKQRRALNIIVENVQALIQPQYINVTSRTKQRQDRDTL